MVVFTTRTLAGSSIALQPGVPHMSDDELEDRHPPSSALDGACHNALHLGALTEPGIDALTDRLARGDATEDDLLAEVNELLFASAFSAGHDLSYHLALVRGTRSDPNAWVVGKRIEVKGLINASQHNGKHARVIKLDADAARVEVELTSGKGLRLKLENVTLLDVPPPLQPAFSGDVQEGRGRRQGAEDGEEDAEPLMGAMTDVLCNACATCGTRQPAVTLSACSRCTMVKYCSPACQQTGWSRGHRLACSVTRKEDGSIARTRVAGGPLDKQMADIVASTASQEEGLYVIHVKLVLGDLQELGRADSALTAECFVKLGQLVSIDDHPLPDAQLNALLRRVADQLAGAVIEPMLSCCERACKEEQLVAFRALREDHADNHSLRALDLSQPGILRHDILRHGRALYPLPSSA